MQNVVTSGGGGGGCFHEGSFLHRETQNLPIVLVVTARLGLLGAFQSVKHHHDDTVKVNLQKN